MNNSIINPYYDRLPGSYLFSTIAKKIKEYQGTHENADIIRLGIGDVTSPIIPAVIEAMHKAVNEMGVKWTFRGYGPEQGYDFLREAIMVPSVTSQTSRNFSRQMPKSQSRTRFTPCISIAT